MQYSFTLENSVFQMNLREGMSKKRGDRLFGSQVIHAIQLLLLYVAYDITIIVQAVDAIEKPYTSHSDEEQQS